MKKLFIASMLVIGLIATAQFSQSNQLDLNETSINNSNYDLIIESLTAEALEEEDAPFDFNTKDYLPLGFNPYDNNEYTYINEIFFEEEDAPFDFKTKDYLPIGFNPYATNQNAEVIEISLEEDAPFDFNTKDYLPTGFNPYTV